MPGGREWNGDTVVTLLGQQATKTAIDTALQDLEKQGGVVLIGLFGHGVQYNDDAWFCPWDTTIRKVRDSTGNILREKNGQEMLEPDPVLLISMKQLLDALNACGADNRSPPPRVRTHAPHFTRQVPAESCPDRARSPGGRLTWHCMPC